MIEYGKSASRLKATLHGLQKKGAVYAAIGLTLIALLSITACSSDPDEGGIIGSGIILQGTVDASNFASNNVVEAKSSNGRVTELAINSTNQFSTASLSGTGPWVLSVRSGSELGVYGIAYSDGTRNINRFSDLSLRSWFARESLDIDAEFESSQRFTKLPTAAAYAESVSSVVQLIEPVLTSYNISGEDIISADYRRDDQGIDAFLNRNTVLSESGFVRFVLTDPTTNTQSVTRSTLALSKDFSDSGASAPTVPGSVKALGSASDEIVLVWEPSADDIAVIEYQVLRNGALIATTPYPVYIDSDLLIIQPNSYEIIAVDNAGNVSTASIPVLGTPLLGNDDVAPPAPSVLVQLEISSSAVQLLWAQAGIEDVVSFIIYRGTDEQLPELLLQSTSTLVTDTTVQENQTYCYQVSAVDASGNESNLSENLCVVARDEDALVDGSSSPPVDWNVPDIESLSCDQILSSESLERGVIVLEPGCYSVPETLTIAAGATLTLTEGVVLKFGESAMLLIPRDATLTSNGTRDKPVIMTGEFTLPA